MNNNLSDKGHLVWKHVHSFASEYIWRKEPNWQSFYAHGIHNKSNQHYTLEIIYEEARYPIDPNVYYMGISRAWYGGKQYCYQEFTLDSTPKEAKKKLKELIQKAIVQSQWGKFMNAPALFPSKRDVLYHEFRKLINDEIETAPKHKHVTLARLLDKVNEMYEDGI